MFSIYLKQHEVNENTCQKNTHLTETINKNVVDEWRKGLLWNVHDCIMASMTGSLIESGLTKEKKKWECSFRLDKTCLFLWFLIQRVPVQPSHLAAILFKMQSVIGCHFMLNSGLQLVGHFTLNNRHWLVRRPDTRPGLIYSRPWINEHTYTEWIQPTHTVYVKR